MLCTFSYSRARLSLWPFFLNATLFFFFLSCQPGQQQKGNGSGEIEHSMASAAVVATWLPADVGSCVRRRCIGRSMRTEAVLSRSCHFTNLGEPMFNGEEPGRFKQ